MVESMKVSALRDRLKSAQPECGRPHRTAPVLRVKAIEQGGKSAPAGSKIVHHLVVCLRRRAVGGAPRRSVETRKGRIVFQHCCLNAGDLDAMLHVAQMGDNLTR